MSDRGPKKAGNKVACPQCGRAASPHCENSDYCTWIRCDSCKATTDTDSDNHFVKEK